MTVDAAAHQHGRRRLGRHACPTCGQERDRGAVLVMVALSLGFLVAATALTIDIGRLLTRRRDMQAVADVVALDLVRRIDGQRTLATIQADPDWSATILAARTRNDFPVGASRVLIADLGHMSGSDFVQDTDPASAPSAVKVTASDRIDYYFAPGGNSVSRSAVAAVTATVKFKVGSFLAAVDAGQKSLLNAVLGRALGGGSLNLQAVSYQGLSAATIDVGALAAQLGFATPYDLMNGTVDAKQFFLASASVLSAQGDTAAANAFNAAAAEVKSKATVQPGRFATITQGGPTGAVAGTFGLNGLATLSGAAFLINGSNTISVPGLDLGIAGVTSADLTLQVTESPQERDYAVPNAACSFSAAGGNCVNTSQVRLSLVPQINIAVPQRGIGGQLTSITGSMSITAQSAGANAWATAASCATLQQKSATLALQPSPVTMTLSENLAISLLKLPPLPVVVSATMTPPSVTTTVTGSTSSHLFNYTADFGPEAGAAGPVTMGSSSLGLANSLQATATNVNVTTLGGLATLGLTSSALANLINGALNPVLTDLDQYVLQRLARALGIDMGGGDVTAEQLRCSTPKIVQ